MASSVTRDHHSLRRNLKLNDKYLSNDGGDEGIRIDDAGDVGINIPTTISPATKLEVFNSNVQYSTGTAYQSGVNVIGSGTTFTAAMEGGRFVFDDGTDAGIITAFGASTVIIVSTSQTVGASDDLRSYKIYYPSVQIDTGASSTSLKIGNMSLGKDGTSTILGTDIALSSDGGNITMDDGTTTIFDFNVDNPSFTIKDAADTLNSFSIIVGDNANTIIQTVDNDGSSANLTLTIDGYIKCSGTFLWYTNPLLIDPITLTASGTTDYSLKVEETLNLSSGAGGSDVHHGIWYAQTQTDLTGWDSVYLMYLTGGDAARTFAIQADGKVGIGVTDPDSLLEVFGESAQLKLSWDDSNHAAITVADDGHLELATTGTDGDITLDSASGIMLETTYLYIYPSSASTQSFYFNMSGDPKFTINSEDDAGDEFSIQVNDAGATTLTTVDDDGADAHLTIAPDGDCIIDRDTTLTATATAKGLHIDYDHTDISASGQTITGIGLDLDMNCETVTHVGAVNQIGIDIDMVAATDGVQTNVGIGINCSGSNTCTGITIDTAAAGAGSSGIYIDNKNGGTDFKNVSAVNATDYFTINTVAAGATTLTTVDTSVGATAHLTIVADGHVEFDGCAVGFDKEITIFAASAVLSEGDDSTDIDFRLGNKHELTLTDDIAGSGEYINMIFPATSGNFILVLIQGVADCTVNSAGWRVYQSDGATLATNVAGNNQVDGRVRWAADTAPTLSTSQYDIDIVSIYWDADNQTAFAVISQAF